MGVAKVKGRAAKTPTKPAICIMGFMFLQNQRSFVLVVIGSSESEADIALYLLLNGRLEKRCCAEENSLVGSRGDILYKAQ